MFREGRPMGRGWFELSSRGIMLRRACTAAELGSDIDIRRAALGRIFVINIGRTA
jgi:hypothetical protein